MVTSEECSRLLVSGAKIKPDADISGIGVILAFLITAYASFVAILAAYICGMVERELLSLADVKVMRIRPRTERHPRMHRILRQTIIVLSDQQIVTGIAIMTAGFVGLRSGQISVYHYQIVLYLAWLSSSVHLSALTLLRPFLNRHAGVKVWRLVGMGALFIMLVIGLVPTVSYDWGIINFMDPKDSSIGENNLTGWGVPASCFWGKTYADGVNNDAPIGYVLLVISYVWKIGDVFGSGRLFYASRIRRPLERAVESLLTLPAKRYHRTQQKRYLWCFRLLLIPCIPFIAVLEFLASFSASLWLSALGLLFGTVQIIVPRNQTYAQTHAQEEHWGFGQLVPLVLLVQPLGTILEQAWVSHGSAGTEDTESHETAEKSDNSMIQGRGHATPVQNAPFEEPERCRADQFVLLQILGSSNASNFGFTNAREDAPRIVEAVFSSRVATVLVTLLHITLLGGIGVILYFDIKSIGFVRGQNWEFALLALAFYVGSSWSVMCTLGIYGSLGRSYKVE
ncbi:hypothetical protein D0869_04563 [Hortaea werneckii]|uniref:Uncharacterized protein n=1 Tax=Hortaea werneckii TaxID=91943 RepID=A0A3M6X1W7_HORWE|nr:hypothetical protein KC334_g868 [Hortaea werneckii]KAI7026097.1 hypothetical protein KC355_g777 [Hortaea werneckii]KAI7199292.1 hypothetical protein KC324_g3336 [Hortaea werneckii]KAI7590460.1 hypothetical protein KC316_g3370 [Hortaea werneckii]KAI7675794.1 hypothetical protein KC318_g713 [Hortaea werneckii]